MSLRALTIRRLAILFGVLLLMVGACAALYWRNEHAKAGRMAQSRAAGMSAYQAGDYRAALDSLKYYVARDQGKQDAEALYAYGVARARLEEPNGKHIVEGITVFNAVLQIDPTHLEAKHRLLELYTRASFRNQEAIELADRVLVQHPDDVDALRAKMVAHDRLRQWDKALAASQKLNDINPGDLGQQIATCALMRKLNVPPQGVLDRAIKQQRAHPDDPRFALLLADAYARAGDGKQGREWLTRAATRPAPDAAFVRQMVAAFDSIKLYGESERLLARVTQESSDPLILLVLTQRQWQSGRNDLVLKQLADLDPAAKDAHPGLLAYKAMALYDTGKKDDARAIVAAMESRKDNADALAWSTALSARFNGDMEAKAQLQQYQAALVRAPDNAVIRYLVGEAYQRLGETDLALGSWRHAALLSPSWASPHIQAARALSANGRVKEALEHAERAYKAGPANADAAVTLASVEYRWLEESGDNPAEEARLLQLVTNIQKSVPGEPETLPLYADLLAKAGRRDDAVAAVRAATKSARPFDASVLLHLAAVNRANGLGLDDEIRAATGSTGAADTPRLALARATDLAATGNPQGGLKLIEETARAATTQPAQWRVAVTQYKEMIHDPSARGEWIELGDKHASDLSVQNAILKSANSARDDREFFSRTIERVKTLTGTEGQTWKLERARWLLGGDGGKDTAEAVNILSEIVRGSPTQTEARLLLASAFDQAGNIAGATKELQAAADLESNRAAIAIETARLLQQQSKFVESRSYLERAAKTSDLSADSRRRIAKMLSEQGEYDSAVKVLKDDDGGDDADDPRIKLLLADVYRHAGKLADAEAIYTELLAATPLQLDTVRAAADFFASQGRVAEGRKLLDRIAETKARPGQAELVRAAFAERYNSPEAARDLFAAATKAAPADPAVWRSLVAYHLRGGRYDDARAAGEQGATAVAPREDMSLNRLTNAAQALARLAAQNAAPQSVLAPLAATVGEDRGVSEFLSGARPASQPASNDDPLARLKGVAGKYPRSIPLQSALVQWHVARGEFNDAGRIADRLMEAYPNDPDPARVAAGVWRAAGQYDVAASAIQKWRDRSPSPDHALQADVMTAELRLAQGDAPSAVKALQPHLEALKKDPKASGGAFTTLMRAQVLSGRTADARRTLEPMLADEWFARSLWLQLAAVDIKDPAVATDWMRVVTPKLKTDSTEQAALGSAWYTLSSRPRTARVDGAADEAAKVLDAVIARNNAPPDAMLLRAALLERAGDTKAAEDLYRRGLKLAPDQPQALNNLAYLVLIRGGDVDECMSLITRAVALAPNSASLYDTLARVQVKRGEREQGIESFRKAIQLEPNSLEAMIGLGTALQGAGNRDAAAALLPQIETLMKSRPSLPPSVRHELDTLRATVKASF